MKIEIHFIWWILLLLTSPFLCVIFYFLREKTNSKPANKSETDDVNITIQNKKQVISTQDKQLKIDSGVDHAC